MTKYIALLLVCLLGCTAVQAKDKPTDKSKKLKATASTFTPRGEMEYMLLATKKTSTMQKEMNDAGAEGYHFEGTMGGQTANGGNEAVVIMGRPKGGKTTASFQFKLLATNKTSTMQKEMDQVAAAGFVYRGQSVFETSFGGKEVVVIMELGAEGEKEEYKLMATTKTSTMQKEMNLMANEGFLFCGITVSETAFGGKELVVIMRRPRR